MRKAALLTISDRCSTGERQDRSGPLLRDMLRSEGYNVAHYEILPDEQDLIALRLRQLADEYSVDLVVTTGGTGLSPRDVTPEATTAAVDRLVPGIAEAMRSASLVKTRHAMLSRAVAGVRGQTLIINLPGSERAARENLQVVLPALSHAIDKIQGDPAECGSV
ncbi:MAG: MogA/MoaB family molybdenum cofactor biosynthesis protein [Deltaproteobacteria bacterium]|nr:MogA/MoaB family molybdenum cofactor biosynthesis protein [Deltaproteobacteria bacterium]MBW2071921.1 MogA/MoaB family molybdenum cofactor biosynthesis protein [Deltaproteobacteria bacterium]